MSRGIVYFGTLVMIVPALAWGLEVRGEVQLDLAISPNGLTQSFDVEIAASHDRFFAVWSEAAASDEVYYADSSDAGTTWSSPPLWIDVDTTTNDTEPVVAADGDLVCIGWFHKPEIGGPEDISAVVSTDGGLTFGQRINISGSFFGDSGDADLMNITLADPFIYIVFEDDRFNPGQAEDLYVVSSRDRGQSFDLPLRLNDTLPGTIDVDEPRITTTGADAYVTWKDERAVNDRIFFVSTVDGGLNWSASNTLISFVPSAADCDGWSTIAASDDYVYIAWLDNRGGPPSNSNNQVFFRRSTNKGLTWHPDEQVGGTPLGAWAVDLDIAAAGSNVYVAFRDTRNAASYDVYVAASCDWGKTFPDVVAMDSDLGSINSISPRLAAVGDAVFCAYQDQAEALFSDVAWLGYSSAHGTAGSWTRAQVSLGPLAAYDIDTNRIAATDESHAVVIWEDDRANHPSDLANDIYANNLLPAAPLLSANPETISASTGGTVSFILEAGTAQAGRDYLLLGSMSGTQPGLPLPGGLVTLPLNRDAFTDYILGRLNTPVFMNFLGTLNGAGNSTAQLNSWPKPGFVGSTMHYAYALRLPWDFVSNAVAIEIVP